MGKWPGWTQKRGRSYSSKKAGEYCSSELIHLNSATHKTEKRMLRGEEKTDLVTEAKKLQQRWKRDGWSVFVCFKSFPPALYLRLFFWFSFLCFFVSPSPTGSCTSFVPAADLICKKNWSQDQQVVPAGLWFLFSFPFFSLFSLLQSIFPTSQ